MIDHLPDGAVDADALARLEAVLDDTIEDHPTRRSLLARAAGLAVAGSVLAVPGAALACSKNSTRIASVLATFEAFGVTLLTNAVKRAPGTPSEAFVSVLRAANIAEYQHLLGLRKVGGTPLTTRFWIPDAVFAGGGAGLFAAIEKQEEVEISAYLVGVTSFTNDRKAFGARLCAEALGTEAEHRVLARLARATIQPSKAIPNNKGFESYPYHTGSAALHASEKFGIGFGKQGTKAGKFYDFPGNPLHTGTGAPNISHQPQ